MKKKVFFALLVFFFSFYCHASEDIEIPMIYYKNDNVIVFGKTEIPIPIYHRCAFDGKQQKLWIHTAVDHTSTFTQVNMKGETEEIFTVNFGGIYVWDTGPFFVVDNIALVCGHRNIMIFVNLETKEFKVFNFSKYRYYPVYGFRDNKVFIFNNVEDKVKYYDCITGEIFDAETDLKEYGFLPLGNAYVGLDKKGKIVIQKFDTGEIIETNVRGIKKRFLGDVSERYYMTEKYLYFSKKDRGYSFTHGIQLFLGQFLAELNHGPLPRKWYRYSLETGKIEKIKTDDPFIDLIGVVEE